MTRWDGALYVYRKACHKKALADKETAGCFPATSVSVMIWNREVKAMETKDVILELRTKRGLSQEFDISINTLLGEPRKLI